MAPAAANLLPRSLSHSQLMRPLTREEWVRKWGLALGRRLSLIFALEGRGRDERALQCNKFLLPSDGHPFSCARCISQAFYGRSFGKIQQTPHFPTRLLAGPGGGAGERALLVHKHASLWLKGWPKTTTEKAPPSFSSDRELGVERLITEEYKCMWAL